MTNKKPILFLILFFLLYAKLFARGAGEEVISETKNNEWILCVTDFDVSSVPEDRLYVAALIKRKIVESLGTVNFRTRSTAEYAFYKEFVWTQERTLAARNLAAGQEERSALIFRGLPEWNYRRELIRFDAQITERAARFDEVMNNPPVINTLPEFRLTSGNMGSVFPPGPQEGDEYNFCLEQNADAFLTGSIREFHGRFIVSLNLYTFYTQSFAWSDSIIFSNNDMDAALAELTGRLLAVLSGSEPATMIVNVQPPDALILVNHAFAGRGDTGSMEFSPGIYTITASADEHETITMEKTLTSGDFFQLDFYLRPIEYIEINIFSGGTYEGLVYIGALYMGETPLTLRLPVNMTEYLELETQDGRKGTIVFDTPSDSQADLSLTINSTTPQREGQIKRERNRFYWAWGGMWISGIAAWISFFSFIDSDAAVRYSIANDGTVSQSLLDNNNSMYNISMGVNIALGICAVYGVIQIFRYIRAANRDSTTASRRGRN